MGMRAWVGGLTGLVLACAAGPLLGQTATPPAEPAKQPAAVVNGKPITLAEVDARVKAQGPTPLLLSESQRRQRRLEALTLLIDELLMHQYLEKNAPELPAAEVEKQIEEMKKGLQGQQKSLEEYCQDTNQTPAQLKAGVADMMRWDRYVQPKITDQALQEYFAKYCDFFEGNTVHVHHIVHRLPPNAEEKERSKARDSLNAVREQILAKKMTFAEAARTYSHDVRAKQGGDLGYITRKWMFDEAFSRAAFALKVGEVSTVVETEYGLHLITVTDRKGGEGFDFAKNKEKVREMYSEDLRERIVAEQRKEAGSLNINLP
jgi:peptidyl-prolyl cis-trans isomerase C